MFSHSWSYDSSAIHSKETPQWETPRESQRANAIISARDAFTVEYGSEKLLYRYVFFNSTWVSSDGCMCRNTQTLCFSFHKYMYFIPWVLGDVSQNDHGSPGCKGDMPEFRRCGIRAVEAGRHRAHRLSGTAFGIVPRSTLNIDGRSRYEKKAFRRWKPSAKHQHCLLFTSSKVSIPYWGDLQVRCPWIPPRMPTASIEIWPRAPVSHEWRGKYFTCSTTACG